MPIKIAEYQPEHEVGVAGLNQRLRAGGSHWAFYVRARPRWLPPGHSDAAERRYYLAVDDSIVRGGYCLKRQAFVANSAALSAASIQGPVSESLVDSRFSMLPVVMLRDMLRREQLLFAWGASPALTGLLDRLHWRGLDAPLLLRFVDVSRCLRQLRDLRQGPYLRAFLPFAAATGLGAVATHTAQRLRMRGGSDRAILATEVLRFGPWADRIWTACASAYAFAAVRDSAAMNGLLPEGPGWPEHLILRVDRDGEPIGWAVVRDMQFAGDDRFGGLRVGSVIDSLSLPGLEVAVVAATTRFLAARRVDLILSYDSTAAWVAAYRSTGFFHVAARRRLYLSPELNRRLGEPQSLADFRLTPLDGDGPHGF